MLTDRPAYASLDADLRFVSVNDRLLKYLGKRREDLVGHLYWDVYPEARGQALHKLILEAQSSMQAVKRRVWSEPLNSWLDIEVFPLTGGVQVAFTAVEGERPPKREERSGSAQ